MARGSRRGKTVKGHWAKRAMPARIPDTPENVARALLSAPPKKPAEWEHLRKRGAGGWQGWLETAPFRLVYNSLSKVCYTIPAWGKRPGRPGRCLLRGQPRPPGAKLTSKSLKRPLILLFLLGAGTGLIAAAVALAVGNGPGYAFGVGLAYLCGVFLGGWLTMGALSALGKLAMFILDRQQEQIDRVMGATEQAFDRVTALMDDMGRDKVLRHPARRRKTPGPPSAFGQALSKWLWKISPYTGSIGILWTACGLIILALHSIGGLGNPPALYALPVGGIILLSLAAGIYLSGYWRLWQMLRRAKDMLAELRAIEQELTAETGNRPG